MPSAFNEAAEVVIKAWRPHMPAWLEEDGTEPTNEQILEHVFNTVNVDEVDTEYYEREYSAVAQDPVTVALHTLFHGPYVPTFGNLTYLPSWQELADIVQLVRLPNEPLNYAQSNLTTLTQLQRLWIHLARVGKLPQRV